MGVKQSSSCFGGHTVACSAYMSRRRTAVVNMSTLLNSSQEDIGYVAAGRGGNIPSVIGMISGGILS